MPGRSADFDEGYRYFYIVEATLEDAMQFYRTQTLDLGWRVLVEEPPAPTDYQIGIMLLGKEGGCMANIMFESPPSDLSSTGIMINATACN